MYILALFHQVVLKRRAHWQLYQEVVTAGGVEGEQYLLDKCSFKNSFPNPITSLKPFVLEILEPPLLVGIRVLESLQVNLLPLYSALRLLALRPCFEPWFLI